LRPLCVQTRRNVTLRDPIPRDQQTLSPPPLFIHAGAPDPLDLHSFPTRRSSDLFGGIAGGAFYGVNYLVGGSGSSSNQIAQADTDRKSTRLNSSHVSISYAVFCLKKKTRSERNLQSNATPARKTASIHTPTEDQE